MPETKRLVVQTAVTQLFERKWFSISELNEIMELIGARTGGEAHQMLHALHCVHYDKMPPDLRARVPHLVNECLRQKDNVQDAAMTALHNVEI